MKAGCRVCFPLNRARQDYPKPRATLPRTEQLHSIFKSGEVMFLAVNQEENKRSFKANTKLHKHNQSNSFLGTRSCLELCIAQRHQWLNCTSQAHIIDGKVRESILISFIYNNPRLTQCLLTSCSQTRGRNGEGGLLRDPALNQRQVARKFRVKRSLKEDTKIDLVPMDITNILWLFRHSCQFMKSLKARLCSPTKL